MGSPVNADNFEKVLSILKYSLALLANPTTLLVSLAALLLLAGAVYFIYKQAANKAAWDRSQEIKKEEKASNPVVNDKIEKDAAKAEKQIEEIRKKNPDSKKLPRPPVE